MPQKVLLRPFHAFLSLMFWNRINYFQLQVIQKKVLLHLSAGRAKKENCFVIKGLAFLFNEKKTRAEEPIYASKLSPIVVHHW